MPNYFENVVLLASNETAPFAERVYGKLKSRLEHGGGEAPEFGHIRGGYFPDKEIYVQVDTNLREKKVVCFHDMCGYDGSFDPNIGMMKLVLTDDALRNSTPERIIHVVPFMPYMRQDREDKPRVPVSAKVVLNMVGQDSKGLRCFMLTYDIHTQQAKYFANNIYVENIPTERLFYEHMIRRFVTDGKDPDFKHKEEFDEVLRDKVVIVSPDAGGAERARSLAKRFGGDIVVIDKRREGPGKSKPANVLGVEYVNGREAIIYDDIIDTAGTLGTSAAALWNAGAQDVYEFAPHDLRSVDKEGRRAEDKIRDAKVKIVTTDSIPMSPSYMKENADYLTVLSLDDLTTEALFESRAGGSFSRVFRTKKPSLPDEFLPAK